MKTMLIVLWFETHISTSVNSTETLPPIYTSYRRDWADDWGGVIIINCWTNGDQKIVWNGSNQCENLSEASDICIFLQVS